MDKTVTNISFLYSYDASWFQLFFAMVPLSDPEKI